MNMFVTVFCEHKHVSEHEHKNEGKMSNVCGGRYQDKNIKLDSCYIFVAVFWKINNLMAVHLKHDFDIHFW